MATVETRTFSPMTMTPATSSITTFAGLSVSTLRFSTWDMNETMSWPPGERRVTIVGLSARADPGKRVLTASAILRAVEKSGLRSCMVSTASSRNCDGTSRSTIAPPGTRPEVGTPLDTVSAWPWAAKPETITGPCATA